jgi:hypothetical protein
MVITEITLIVKRPDSPSSRINKGSTRLDCVSNSHDNRSESRGAHFHGGILQGR